jgi:DNA-binding response OmpR family regulator
VGDDEKIRELLSTRLRQKGHHVLTASYSQKDMVVFRRKRSHVTILDIEMPNQDGLAVLRYIRELIPALSFSMGRPFNNSVVDCCRTCY